MKQFINNENMLTRKCLFCGKEFEANHRNRKYCYSQDDRCKREFEYAQKVKKRESELYRQAKINENIKILKAILAQQKSVDVTIEKLREAKFNFEFYENSLIVNSGIIYLYSRYRLFVLDNNQVKIYKE